MQVSMSEKLEPVRYTHGHENRQRSETLALEHSGTDGVERQMV